MMTMFIGIILRVVNVGHSLIVMMHIDALDSYAPMRNVMNGGVKIILIVVRKGINKALFDIHKDFSTCHMLKKRNVILYFSGTNPHTHPCIII